MRNGQPGSLQADQLGELGDDRILALEPEGPALGDLLGLANPAGQRPADASAALGEGTGAQGAGHGG